MMHCFLLTLGLGDFDTLSKKVDSGGIFLILVEQKMSILGQTPKVQVFCACCAF